MSITSTDLRNFRLLRNALQSIQDIEDDKKDSINDGIYEHIFTHYNKIKALDFDALVEKSPSNKGFSDNLEQFLYTLAKTPLQKEILLKSLLSPNKAQSDAVEKAFKLPAISAKDTDTLKPDEIIHLRNYIQQAEELQIKLGREVSQLKENTKVLESIIQKHLDLEEKINLSYRQMQNFTGQRKIIQARQSLATLYDDDFLYFDKDSAQQSNYKLILLASTASIGLTDNNFHLHHLINNHKSHDNSKRIAVIGAGPTGLMAALKLYHEGAKIDLIEARKGDKLHNRRQSVLLDPAIMADLRYYLGPDFDALFYGPKRIANVTAKGQGQITINELEKALFKKIQQIAHQDKDMKIHLGKKADKVLPPAEDNESFRITLEGSKKEYPCDYIYSAEGTRGGFVDRGPFCGSIKRAKVETEQNEFATFIYDIKGTALKAQSEHLVRGNVAFDKFHANPRAEFRLGKHYHDEGYHQRIQWEEKVRLIAANLGIIERVSSNGALKEKLAQAKNIAMEIAQNTPEHIELRNFETKGQYYVASKLPIGFTTLIKEIRQLSDNNNLSKRHRNEINALEQELMQAWSDVIADIKYDFLKADGVSLNHQSSTAFPVTPIGLAYAGRKLVKDDKELMVAAGGDVFRSPHFYSGSGISGSHGSVNAFVKLFKGVNQTPHHKKTHEANFINDMQQVARFVDDNMDTYLKVKEPLPQPQSILVTQVGSEAIDFDNLLKEISLYREKLDAKKAKWYVFAKEKDLLTLKCGELTKITTLLKDSKSPDYNTMRDKIDDVDVNVLAMHRSSLFNRGKTHSQELVERLHDSVHPLCTR
jgi:hypothetical protein